MRLFVGFLIGSVLGVALGTIVGLSKAIERYVAPSIAFLSPVPVSAWIPLVIILFGIGDMAKSYLISIGTFFVVYASTFSGIRNADYKLIEMAKLLNKTRFTLAINILLPSALPMILHGLRGALALGWILLIVAEVVASTTGLGWLIWDSRNFARADDMVAGMIVVGAFGAITDYVMSLIQARLLFWRKTFDGV
jgi:sulfonate transport system permease protein